MAGPGKTSLIGKITLVAGVGILTIPGVTTNSSAFVQLATPGGTLSSDYKAVCTANTLTVTSINTGGATNSLDTSILNYQLYY